MSDGKALEDLRKILTSANPESFRALASLIRLTLIQIETTRSYLERINTALKEVERNPNGHVDAAEMTDDAETVSFANMIVLSASARRCFVCRGRHDVLSCFKVREAKDRIAFLDQFGVCTYCGKHKKLEGACRSRSTIRCTICGGDHCDFLHPY